MPLFWLTYHHPDGRAASVVVIESRGLLHARLKASLAGANRGLEFASGQQLDPISRADSGEDDRTTGQGPALQIRNTPPTIARHPSQRLETRKVSQASDANADFMPVSNAN
jgi:hypothetical protein